MNKINDKTKKFMIFGIIILVIAIVGSTLAYYIWSSGEQIKISTTVGGAYVYFDGGSSIENATLRPVSDKSEGITKNISMRADSVGVTANVYLDLISLPNSLKDVSFRYAIYNGSTLTKEGNFSSTSLTSSTSSCTVNNTTHITLLSNVSVPTTKTTYTLYIWIDGANYTNPKSMMNQTFSFKLHADGTGAILNNEYELTNSDGSTYTPTYSGSGTKAVRSSAPLSKFKEVKVDDTIVDSSNYTLTEGSTIVTFKETYLKSLSAGDHTFKIISSDGIAEGKMTIEKLPSAAQTIANLYNNASKTTVTNNSIEYNTAPSVGLMNDRLGGTTTSFDGGNIRYYGDKPDNYIYFNCSDYANQSSSTCEIWRIIGIFDGKLKLIRYDSIGSYSWDNKNTSTGAESANGKNDWTTARLMKLLNPSNYYTTVSGELGQSLYYKGTAGKCYSGRNNATIDCDFSTVGIKNDTTRNMIAEVVWNIGGCASVEDMYPDQVYACERDTMVYSNQKTTWKGKVGLAYPSDYGYAASLEDCNTLLYYSDYYCSHSSWLYWIFSVKGGHLFTPNYLDSESGYFVEESGGIQGSNVYEEINIYPVIYIDTNVILKSGTGSSSDPYQLNV